MRHIKLALIRTTRGGGESVGNNSKFSILVRKFITKRAFEGASLASTKITLSTTSKNNNATNNPDYTSGEERKKSAPPPMVIEIKSQRTQRSNLMRAVLQARMTGETNSKKGPEDSNERPGAKRMTDSFCEVLLPFTKDSVLREEYISIHGGLRLGKLLEDLDALAASIAYLHCNDADLTLVTAAVDRIDLLKSFDDRMADIRMRGFVTFVGRSSMEVTMAVEMAESNADESSNSCKEQEKLDTSIFASHVNTTDTTDTTSATKSATSTNGMDLIEEFPYRSGGGEGNVIVKSWELAALAKFVFVARSLDGKEAVPVNRLVLETDREKELFKLGEARHKYRLRRNETSLFRQPPTEAESFLLHKLLVSGGTTLTVPMSKTEMRSIRICHPQERNIHNFIFGGYLMREAYELAYATAAVFTRGTGPLVVTTVDDLNFVHPVPIGSLLCLEGHIVYTDRDPQNLDLQRLHVEVTADVVDPINQTRRTTNTFHFTFSCKTPPNAPVVVPETYTEAMRYLEGKRRVDFNDQQHQQSTKSHF